MTVEFDPLDLVDPARFAQRGYPHDLWTRLRAEDPIAFAEPPGFKPFWAVTKYADIQKISAQPNRFSNAQGITLAAAGAPPIPPQEILVLLDPPRHGPMRRLVIHRFTPRAVRAQRPELDRVAAEVVGDALVPSGAAELDFVEQVAAPYPLALIAWILGVPQDDWDLLYQLSNEVIGKDDPEYRRPGESPGQTMKRARGEIHRYFDTLVARRRDDPQDDIITDLLNGRIDGEPLTHTQVLSYCELLIEAGNETTRNAIAGAMLAFCENSDQWARLRAEPELVPLAVEEILRWVSPIIYFVRVATEDCELAAKRITAGDQLALFYASANRDEEVFDDPFSFRIDRHPNPHLAFGFGEHFCVGAHLARTELELMLRHLLGRIDEVALAAPIERLGSNVNGSIKRLPLRYRIG